MFDDRMIETEGGVFPLSGKGRRPVTFTIRSAGATVIGVNADGDKEVLYAGVGNSRVRVKTDATALIVAAWRKDGYYQLNVPENRHPFGEAVFYDDPSFTDLSPRPMGAISPEIQAVMDQMNRNAIIREQAMLKSLGPRLPK